jgi:hypothetical protein
MSLNRARREAEQEDATNQEKKMFQVLTRNLNSPYTLASSLSTLSSSLKSAILRSSSKLKPR